MSNQWVSNFYSHDSDDELEEGAVKKLKLCGQAHIPVRNRYGNLTYKRVTIDIQHVTYKGPCSDYVQSLMYEDRFAILCVRDGWLKPKDAESGKVRSFKVATNPPIFYVEHFRHFIIMLQHCWCTIFDCRIGKALDVIRVPSNSYCIFGKTESCRLMRVYTEVVDLLPFTTSDSKLSAQVLLKDYCRQSELLNFVGRYNGDITKHDVKLNLVFDPLAYIRFGPAINEHSMLMSVDGIPYGRMYKGRLMTISQVQTLRPYTVQYENPWSPSKLWVHIDNTMHPSAKLGDDNIIVRSLLCKQSDQFDLDAYPLLGWCTNGNYIPFEVHDIILKYWYNHDWIKQHVKRSITLSSPCFKTKCLYDCGLSN